MSLTVLLDFTLACSYQLCSEMCHEKRNKKNCQSVVEIAQGIDDIFIMARNKIRFFFPSFLSIFLY